MNTRLSYQILILVIFFFKTLYSIHFCFLKQTNNNHLSSAAANNEKNIVQNQIPAPQLKSYHPHYLISLSYPSPITPHIYYGEVIGSIPVFLYSDVEKWHPQTIQRLTINGIEYTDASAKYFLLRRQQQFRYMLVIQMENSFQREINYTMQVLQRKDHFLIVCHYENTTNSFVIHFTQKGKIVNLDENSHPGIKVNIRNESLSNARENWMFSRRVRWTGKSNINRQYQNYTGFILEIQFNDINLLHQTKINFKEIQSKSYLSLDEFIANEPTLFSTLNSKNQNLHKNIYNNCSETAYEKIFDGLSYQYGRLRIKDRDTFIENQPKGLLSFSPSRKRFPWGFLWDDGFHCEVAVRKDPKIVVEVIKSWLNTMLDNGWIPREQNRGAEREMLCSCPRFMEKDIKDGNPPTLLLALDYLRRKNMLLKEAFPLSYWQKLKKWYNWFMSTQKDQDVYLFKWHDSLNQQGASFTSGMDDFPRPLFSKGHIDLQTWMYFFTKFMAEASHIYGQHNTQYSSAYELIKNNFRFYIDPKDQTFRDIALDSSFSQHFGYPNILPIAFGIPQYKSPQYNATIQKIKSQLDTGNGLASISTKSSYYLANSDAYWRGPVWININYLFLRGLKLYYPNESQLYNKLRNDLLKTVCGNWQKSGYFYQNYIRGIGSFGHPFNGWTSLIALIQQQNY